MCFYIACAVAFGVGILSLGVIVLVLGITTVASLAKTRREPDLQHNEERRRAS